MLAKFGIQVDIAGDGQEALRALALLPYDLVFMDCQMPVMDGYEATALIRDSAWHTMDPDIPVVAMTANARPEDHARCLEAGMDDYVSKPVDPNKLSQALQRWLPEQCHPANDTEQLEIDQANPIGINHPTAHLADSSGHGPGTHRLMVNDDELMRMVTAAYMGDMVDLMAYLNEMVSNRSVEEAVALAHKIRGAAINLGGVTLSILANKMEQQGKPDEVRVISRAMTGLEQPTFETEAENQLTTSPADSGENSPDSNLASAAQQADQLTTANPLSRSGSG